MGQTGELIVVAINRLAYPAVAPRLTYPTWRQLTSTLLKMLIRDADLSPVHLD